MKKHILFLFLCTLSLCAQAQSKERRVYYLDITHSMVKPNGIWDDVRKDLKKAIDKVQDQTTELIVVPFTDSKHPLTVWKENATTEGKNNLKNKIDNLQTDKNCYTEIDVPLEHFYEHYINSSKDVVTYMFLMTDGACHSTHQKTFQDLLSAWDKKMGNKYIYGFYVMLHKEANVQAVTDIIEPQKQIYVVNSANVDINIIRLEDNVVFNVRNDEYIDIPIKTTKGKIDASIEASLQDADYSVSRQELQGQALRVYLTSEKDHSQLPTSKKITLQIESKPDTDKTFVVSQQIHVICKSEKEYSLKIYIK